MNEAEYLKRKKQIIKELFKIEWERKRINKVWRDAVAENKALDAYLINEED